MDNYLQDIFEELYRDDGMAVVGRGLGVRRLLLKFLEKYCLDNSSALNCPSANAVNSSAAVLATKSSSGSSNQVAKKIVFCINAGGNEDSILNGLLAEGVLPHQLPKVNLNLFYFLSSLNIVYLC